MGFLDDLKGKAEEFGEKAQQGFSGAKNKNEEVVDNVKDRFDGDDDTPTLADEPVGYSGEGVEGIKESFGEAAEGATESAGSAVDEAVGGQEAAADRTPDSTAG
jgi:hypothetical protein